VPKIKSAKKAMRQARARTVVNKAQRSALRTALKRVRPQGSHPQEQRGAAQVETRQSGQETHEIAASKRIVEEQRRGES